MIRAKRCREVVHCCSNELTSRAKRLAKNNIMENNIVGNENVHNSVSFLFNDCTKMTQIYEYSLTIAITIKNEIL